MRSNRWARWAICALAISICVPAAVAKSRAKSLADCTSFQRTEKSENTLELSVTNSCKLPIDCKIAWRVVCAPDAKKRRAEHQKSAAFTLTEGGFKSEEASASLCGDDDFEIDHISWSCEPNKD